MVLKLIRRRQTPLSTSCLIHARIDKISENQAWRTVSHKGLPGGIQDFCDKTKLLLVGFSGPHGLHVSFTITCKILFTLPHAFIQSLLWRTHISVEMAPWLPEFTWPKKGSLLLALRDGSPVFSSSNKTYLAFISPFVSLLDELDLKGPVVPVLRPDDTKAFVSAVAV